MNKYLAYQLSGELAQDTINSTQTEYEKSDPLIGYWYNLSIQTATDSELEGIGELIGYPWPSAPASIFASNTFALSAASGFPEASAIGLSSADGSIPGGILTSVAGSGADGKIPSSAYRLLLDRIAYLKYNGLTWKAVDNIASYFGTYQIIIPSLRYFLFGQASLYPESTTIHGFSGIGLTTGGLFSSVNPAMYPDSDIKIGYSPSISSTNLWVCQEIFLAVCTAPQVFVQNGV
jgi:hypothetical protein